MGKQRESGVELLKLAALFIIVISHVTQSLGRDMSAAGIPNDYLLHFKSASADPVVLVLAVFRHFGSLGNLIFFVCSAWFLCDSKRAKTDKIISLAADIWVVSVLMLAGFLLCGVRPSATHILRSLLPTTFSNNWYMTTYLLFYAIHGYLNLVMEKMGQRTHLTTAIVLGGLYCVLGSLKSDLYCGNDLTLFISVYFIICYLKKYGLRFMNAAKANRILLAVGIAASLGLILLTNYAGLRIPALSGYLLRWNRNNNPLFLMIAIAMLNLARQHRFVSPAINYCSGLSFLIYILHENLLVSGYLRTAVWHELYQRFSHDLILVQVLVFSVVLLLAAGLLGAGYQLLPAKLVHGACAKLSAVLAPQYRKMTDRIMNRTD